MMMIATFAAGCFWGVEHYFSQLDGVISTRVGYCNGHALNPDYKQVCTGETGHAEAIEIHFDETLLSYQALLDAFWQMHDPTTANQQGPDIGTQYRSAVFYHDDLQRQQAEKTKQTLEASARFSRPIVTEVTAAETFYPAEEYHQCYVQKNQGCQP